MEKEILRKETLPDVELHSDLGESGFVGIGGITNRNDDSLIQQQADMLAHVAPHLSSKPQVSRKRFDEQYGPDESDFLGGQDYCEDFQLKNTELPPPLSVLNDSQVGFWRGIQGECNSCYIDCCLISMFGFESIFDHLIHEGVKVKKSKDQKIEIERAKLLQIMLRDCIVRNLRTRAYVDRQMMLQWRKLLDFWLPGNDVSKGATSTQEREISELLNVLFEILGAPSYVRTSVGPSVKEMMKKKRPTSTKKSKRLEQDSWLYELIVDPPTDSLLGDEEAAMAVFPTVQELLEGSLRESNVNFMDIPPVLIMQMPRSGDGVKAFPRIFPSFRLRLKHLLENEAKMKESWILTEDQKNKDDYVVVPELEVSQGENNSVDIAWKKARRSGVSVPPLLDSSEEEMDFQKNLNRAMKESLNVAPKPNETDKLTDDMQLFAVVSIHTGHFVSFLYAPSENERKNCSVSRMNRDECVGDGEWYFFDSMADRADGESVPQLMRLSKMAKYLGYPSERLSLDKRLKNPNPANLTEYEEDKYVERLVNDCYVCFYRRI